MVTVCEHTEPGQEQQNRKALDSEPMQTVDRNIAAVHRVRQDADDYRRRDQVFIDRFAEFLGSTQSIYAHLLTYGLLFAAAYSKWFENLATPLVTTNGISLIVSLEAIFLALCVLINQKRMVSLERKSSDLHLQMSLLAEHEVTRLARVIDLIAERLGVSTEGVKDFKEVTRDVDPQEIMERIQNHETENPTDSTSVGVNSGPKKRQ